MSDRLRRELERWGFSETEIAVYTGLLRVNEGTAADVAERADVSKRHVYRICDDLEERGLVDVHDHVQPTRLRARPPSVVEKVFERSTDQLTAEIQSVYTRRPETDSAIEVLKRQPTVLDRTARMVVEAERWVIAVLLPEVVASIADELAAAVDRGVLVFLVTNVDELSIDRPLEDIATVAKTRQSPMGFQDYGVGADKIRSLMVARSAPLGDEHRHSPALYLDDETIGVRTNDSLFGIEWRLADERMTPAPAALPHETSMFREAVLHAALHHRAGTDLHARVEANATDSSERRVLDGAVRSVRQGMIEPAGQTFVGERRFVLETDDGAVSVGGSAATIEDYAAERVTLYDPGDATP